MGSAPSHAKVATTRRKLLGSGLLSSAVVLTGCRGAGSVHTALKRSDVVSTSKAASAFWTGPHGNVTNGPSRLSLYVSLPSGDGWSSAAAGVLFAGFSAAYGQWQAQAATGGATAAVEIASAGGSDGTNLGPYFATMHFRKEALLSGLLSGVTLANNSIPCMPLDPAPYVLLYDKQVVSGSRTVPPATGWSVEQWLSVLGKTNSALVDIPQSDPAIVYAMLLGCGVQATTTGNFDPTSEGAQKAFGLMQALSQLTGGARSLPPRPTLQLRPLLGPHPLGRIPAGYAMTRFPLMPSVPAVPASFYRLVMPADVREPETAAQFIAWTLASSSQNTLVQMGLAPAVQQPSTAIDQWWAALPTDIQTERWNMVYVPGALGLTPTGATWAKGIWQAASLPSAQRASALARLNIGV